MPNFEGADVPLVYAAGVASLVILWAVIVYRLESRRAGGSVWAEWYNDRVVPLWRGRRRPPKAA